MPPRIGKKHGRANSVKERQGETQAEQGKAAGNGKAKAKARPENANKQFAGPNVNWGI